MKCPFTDEDIGKIVGKYDFSKKQDEKTIAMFGLNGEFEEGDI